MNHHPIGASDDRMNGVRGYEAVAAAAASPIANLGFPIEDILASISDWADCGR